MADKNIKKTSFTPAQEKNIYKFIYTSIGRRKALSNGEQPRGEKRQAIELELN